MISIAIDGPAGAGKSSVARGAANELGFIYVDTGALYRTIALYVLRERINMEDSSELADKLKKLRVSIRFLEREQHVFLNDEDATDYIRTPEVSMMASRVSALPPVRAFLLSLQRTLAETNNVIMDGRDIGTVVLPHADVKIFMTAKPECRAKRRFLEMQAKGEDADFDQVLMEIQQRDFNDSHRAIAPLKPAADAQILDTSGMTLPEAVASVVRLVRERTAAQ